MPSQLEVFQESRRSLAQLAARLAAAFARLGSDSRAEVLSRLQGKLESERFRILVLGELGLLHLVLPEAAVEEVRRNLTAKLPEAAPLFEEFLRAVPIEIHSPTARDRERARELADPKDILILAAAIGAGARLLVTHNVRHFRSGEGVRIVRPRTLIEEARAWMGSLGI